MGFLARKARAGAGFEQGIDQPQDRLGRAEGKLQRGVLQRLIGGAQAGGEFGLHPVELGWIGALEGIDRLLLVADHKYRARRLGPGAFAAGELACQLFDHPPLHRAGVLSLVDEDVIDAAIKPVEHPLRHLAIGQKRQRLVDQVVEVEPAAGQLGGLVARQEFGGKGLQGLGFPDRRQGATGIARRLDPAHQVFEPVHDAGQRALARPLGGKAADLGAVGPGLGAGTIE